MIRYFLISVIISITAVSCFSQTNTKYQEKEFTDKAGKTLFYRMLEPEMSYYEKYPLIIFLHGAGERGSDNKSQLIHGAKLFEKKENMKNYPAFVIAPQCPTDKRWVEVDWTLPAHYMPKQISVSLGLTMELLEEIIKKYPIDTNRIYVTGLSMGGFGTWDLISRYPDKFAAAIPICGGADEKQASRIAKVPVWCFHGTKDQVVTVERSRNIVGEIELYGGKPKYTEYPNRGHFSWGEAYSEPELLKWLFSNSGNDSFYIPLKD